MSAACACPTCLSHSPSRICYTKHALEGRCCCRGCGLLRSERPPARWLLPNKMSLPACQAIPVAVRVRRHLVHAMQLTRFKEFHTEQPGACQAMLPVQLTKPTCLLHWPLAGAGPVRGQPHLSAQQTACSQPSVSPGRSITEGASRSTPGCCGKPGLSCG